MFKIVLLNLLTLSSLSSFSQICDEYKIRENFNEEIKKGTLKYTHNNDQFLGPTRDQGSIGYCYAYAGADLYEHWLKKKGLMDKKEHVSAMAMGMMYHKRSWDSLLEKDFLDSNRFKDKMEYLESIDRKHQQETRPTEKGRLLKEKVDLISSFTSSTPEGGFPGDAIKISSKKLCYDSEISSQASNSLKEFFKSGPKNIYESNGFRMEQFQWFLNLENLKNENSEKNKEWNCAFLHSINSIFPGHIFSSTAELKLFLEKLEGSRLDSFINNSCKDKNIKLKPKIRSYRKILGNGGVKLEKMIENALKKGDIASVSYHSNLLEHEDENKFKSDHHESVITGSVDICGTTYYALRNSWGKKQCMVSSLFTKIARGPVFCNDNGDYMVRKDHFLKGAFGATVIEN
ncbi:MAG: hypothetical protein KBD76_11345 [Bacteriovorax sp.]|nr:hypothetical protein [Bacteriovorax sp.]